MKCFAQLACGWCLALAAATAVGQEIPSELTPQQQDELQQALAESDAAAFVAAADAFLGALPADFDADAAEQVNVLIADRAKAFALDVNILASLETREAVALRNLALPALSDVEKQQFAQRVDAALSDLANLNVGQLETRIAYLADLDPDGLGSSENRRTEINDWLAAADLSDAPIDGLKWCFHYGHHFVATASGFRVVWTGYVTPPRTGQYRFSISPWNVSCEPPGGEFQKQSMTVSLNGEQRINASPDAWDYQGDSIDLQAGDPVALRVEFDYERNDSHRLCAAILYWEGPGISRSVVPASALFQDEQDGAPGLRAEYSWTSVSEDGEKEQPLSASRVDPNINFVWINGLVLDVHSDSMQRLAEAFANRFFGEELPTLDDRAGRMLNLLSVERRADVLRQIASRTEALANVSARDMERFFLATRCGAEEESLNVLGQWMRLHKDLEPEFAHNVEDFYVKNRQRWRGLNVHVTFEYPDGRDYLEENYLVDNDESCVLPVAYLCGYGYQVTGRIDEWIEFLDQKLDDDAVVGDVRVNWLIARAHADEIRRGVADRHIATRGRPTAGIGWLQEAELVATTPAVQQRVLKEQFARRTALNQWTAAEEVMQRAAPDMRAALADQLAEFKELAAAEAEQSQAEAREAYLAELQRRYDAAIDSGSDAEAQRFQELISWPESEEDE